MVSSTLKHTLLFKRCFIDTYTHTNIFKDMCSFIDYCATVFETVFRSLIFCVTFVYTDQIKPGADFCTSLSFDLAHLTCKKRFDCRNAVLRSSAILLGTWNSQIVVAVLQ